MLNTAPAQLSPREAGGALQGIGGRADHLFMETALRLLAWAGAVVAAAVAAALAVSVLFGA